MMHFCMIQKKIVIRARQASGRGTQFVHNTVSMSFPPTPSFAKSSAFAGPVALCLLILLIHMAISGGRVAVSLTALELKRSTFEVGILIAVFALLPMLLSVKAGRLLDQIGPWRPMRASAFVVIVGIILPIIWQNFIALVISAACVGVGHMFFQIAVQRQMGLSAGEDRLRNFSWLSLSMATSGLIGPSLAGISIDYLGYRAVFALLAISPIVCVFGLYRARNYLKTSHQPPAETSKTKQSVTDLIASPKLRRVFTANMLLSSAWDTHMFVVPIFGVMVGLSATTIGLILAAFAAATIVVRLALPLLQHRVRPWQLINFALLATGLNFVLYPFF